MQAYEIEITIPENHQILLPAYLPTGAARMLVLVKDGKVPESGSYEAFQEFMLELEASHARRQLPSAEEIDRRIEEARNDWD